MPWLKRHAAWAWSAVLLIGLTLMVLIRLGSAPPARTAAGPPGDSRGVVTGDSDTPPGAAERLQTLQEQAAAVREQLAAAQADLALRRERAATLAEMLATDSLAECPPFLREDTTVRALQKIIRDAAAAQGPLVSDLGSMNTAATVARERLRNKIEALRDEMGQELLGMETKIEGLRRQLRLATDEMENLLQKRQQSRLAPPPGRAT
jgi:hypothetical protein